MPFWSHGKVSHGKMKTILRKSGKSIFFLRKAGNRPPIPGPHVMLVVFICVFRMTVAADRKWYHMLTSIFHQTHYTMMPPGGHNVQTGMASSGVPLHTLNQRYTVEKGNEHAIRNAQHVTVDSVFTATAHRKQDLIIRYKGF